jgi:hypothetical protein
MPESKFWRMLGRNRRRKRRYPPQLPEFTGMALSTRRINRLVAAITVFGACSTVALAVALMPGTQTSATSARAAQGALEISRAKPEPIIIQKVSLPATITAALPEPELEAAPKADRLLPLPAFQQPSSPYQPRVVDLRGPIDSEQVHESDAAFDGPGEERQSAPEADDAPDDGQSQERGVELALSEASTPGERTGEDASDRLLEEVEEAIEQVSQDPLDEDMANPDEVPASDAVAKPATKPVAAARTGLVKTDVNMRAGPDNGAAVIMVVPRNRNVEVIGCDYWCEVVYEGRRGYIYKSFVRKTDS